MLWAFTADTATTLQSAPMAWTAEIERRSHWLREEGLRPNLVGQEDCCPSMGGHSVTRRASINIVVDQDGAWEGACTPESSVHGVAVARDRAVHMCSQVGKSRDATPLYNSTMKG